MRLNVENCINIFAEQMAALKDSGLLNAASEFHVGVNGDEADALVAAQLAGDKAWVICHGPQAKTELSTQHVLQKWLPGHQGWRVLYHHSKGASYHPGDAFPGQWRRCMERAVVWGWQTCMAEMDKGAEACGCHWLTPERWGSVIRTPFFGGTFWWATADFLMTLPKLPEDVWANRFEAESWIGRGPRRPLVVDFHPDWPGAGCHG
jgi:hypothetical protein